MHATVQHNTHTPGPNFKFRMCRALLRAKNMSAESMASPTIGTDSDQNAAPTKERRSWTLQENAMVVEVILAGVRWLAFFDNRKFFITSPLGHDLGLNLTKQIYVK